MALVMSNDPRGAQTQAGRRFYDQLSIQFWECLSTVTIIKHRISN